MFDLSRLAQGLIKSAPRLVGLKRAKQENADAEDAAAAVSSAMAAEDASYDKMINEPDDQKSGMMYADHYSRYPFSSWMEDDPESKYYKPKKGAQ